MQFIKNGPDVPDRLLQAHEDGRVVFFCGAGISYPAKLPGFSGLVSRIYDGLGEYANPIEDAAIKLGQFDTAIGQLEGRIANGRTAVREQISQILTPNYAASNATATHEALLELAKQRNGRLRLITTNFDRIFERVIALQGMSVNRFEAPLLPIPKNRWDGLVYLHGLLPETPSASALDQLVISSGDFGLAYLNERWAARFVGELFRNYTVCFVGYSINDPVLRYMMDALAADRLLGESPPEMYAFGSYSKGKEKDRANEWRAKNVTPILYREHNYHAYLHRTLRSWAATYRDGVTGKERIVAQYAVNPPDTTTSNDDFTKRVIWAISDKSGVPAKRFAELDPVPPLTWLLPLTQPDFRHDDLPRFGVAPAATRDDKLTFSLARRPSPYALAAQMALLDFDRNSGGWDKVMHHIAFWLTRHLDDPELILWMVKHGGKLSENLSSAIRNRIKYLDGLSQAGNQGQIDRIKGGAPRAIPRAAMRKLWLLILGNRLKPQGQELGLYDWLRRAQAEAVSPILRMELRELLAPRITVRERYRSEDRSQSDETSSAISNVLDCDVVLASDYVHHALRDLSSVAGWRDKIGELLPEFESLLRDTLDLMQEIGDASSTHDLSLYHQPSIGQHHQNNDYNEWTALIDLTRDAWLAVARSNPKLAHHTAAVWIHVPYPVFKRMAYFAAAQDGIVSPVEGLEWLLVDNFRWIWAPATLHEAMRLIVKLSQTLDQTRKEYLEQLILEGPLSEGDRPEIENESRQLSVDSQIWLRLANILRAGVALSVQAKTRFDAISAAHPTWILATDERDEFAIWNTGVSSFTGFAPWQQQLVVPRRRRDMTQWLEEHPSSTDFQIDSWSERCRDQFATTACALFDLTRRGVWPVDRWRSALQAWSDSKLRRRSWHYMAPIFASAPDDVIKGCAHGASWWLHSAATDGYDHDAEFVRLADRILDVDDDEGSFNGDPFDIAINHHVGLVTDALLRRWLRQAPEDDQGLPADLEPLLTKLCDVNIARFRHGRVLLAANIITLFRVDPKWTAQHLLPLFNWDTSATEAKSAWLGFLIAPRLFRPFITAIKTDLLATAAHYAELPNHGRQFADLLTFTALELRDVFTNQELARAFETIPQAGLRDAAVALSRALTGSGNQAREYWTNRIQPFLHSLWPKSRDRIAPETADAFARLCIAADSLFPDVFTMVRNWLVVLAHPDYTVHLLHEAELCSKFPVETLDFLDRIIKKDNENNMPPPAGLSSCLESIRSAQPTLESDSRYVHLLTYVSAHSARR